MKDGRASVRRRLIAAPRNAAEALAVSVSIVLCCGAGAAVAEDSGIHILPSMQAVLSQEVPAAERDRQVASPEQTRVASRTPQRGQAPSPTDLRPSSPSAAETFQNPFVSDFPASDELPPVLTEQTRPGEASATDTGQRPAAVGEEPSPVAPQPSTAAQPAPVATTDAPAAPSSPTDPPADPTEPPVDPTDPPVDPTEPPVDPTDPPTDPPVDPTDPATDPTDPVVGPPTAPPTDPPMPTPTAETTAPTVPAPTPVPAPEQSPEPE